MQIPSFDGIILVDKPVGWTSHDVVAKVRGQLKKQTGQKIKLGHTGTLDPFATGLLILVVGTYTKKAGELTGLDKTYQAEAVFGKTSSTGDPEGEINSYQARSAKKPSKADVEVALSSFLGGPYFQTPPAFSAVKIDGQRAYKLARKGVKPQLEPRQVRVYSLRLTNYQFPRFNITASVSSGTYIRTLVEDIGLLVGQGAYTTGLRRTQIGRYRLEKAKSIDKITVNDIIKE